MKPKNNLGIKYLSQWKPCLLPNEPSGTTPDYEERLKNAEEWCYSTKKDGGRVELIAKGDPEANIDGEIPAYSRELKVIPSVQIQAMAKAFNQKSQHWGVVEAEFYSPEMTFAEVMHFFRAEDVTSADKVKEYTALWKRTKQGTIEISKGKEYPAGTLTGEIGKKAVKWRYPGRTVEWLTTWHDSLQFYVFDHYLGDGDKRGKWARYEGLIDLFASKDLGKAQLILQNKFDHVDRMYQAFDQVIIDDEEGLALFRLDAKYKSGRYTINAAQGYKVVDGNKEWEGTVIDIEESTVVKDGIAKTVNAFGRSKTSKKQDDREGSGMAKGLKVQMDNGNILTVSFNGFTHDDRKELLENPDQLMNKRIRFTGKAPVSSRADSVPRQCHFHKGDII